MDRTWAAGVAGAAVDGPLDGLPRPVISHPRRTSVEIHDHLRWLILEGLLPPGTELKQTELARAFDVSRTPLREVPGGAGGVGTAARHGPCGAGREGLIDADISLRGRVTALDAADLDCLWHEAHRAFHRLLVARCTPTVLRTIASYAERSERYVRAQQDRHPDGYARRRQEHYNLFAAVVAGEPDRAVRLIARPLARTAHQAIPDLAPGRQARDVREAMHMVCDVGSNKDSAHGWTSPPEGVHT